MIEIKQASLPLISVVVLTYNSATTVQETLDSLACQEYPAMEVLVCDDGSTDATQFIVSAWLVVNKKLFKRALLLPSVVNEGVCKNISKGYAAARGEWLKPIAGDDLLMPQAILKFAKAAVVSRHDVILSLLKTFGGGLQSGRILPNLRDCALISGPVDYFRHELIIRNPIPAPSVLIRRSAYVTSGGVDYSFMHLDDWPLWMRFLKAGKSFDVVHEVLVQYRVSTTSISKRQMAIYVNRDYLKDIIQFYIEYQRQYLSPARRWDRSIEVFRWKLAIGLLRSHPYFYKCTRLLHVFSPIMWVNATKRSE